MFAEEHRSRTNDRTLTFAVIVIDPCNNLPFVSTPTRKFRAMQLNDQWITAMRALDLDRAWSISDCALRQRLASQYQKHSGPRHLQHIWQGEPLAGKRVLVRCYHGLGDTIQFARYVKPLRRIARSVTVWCQPELQVLLRQLPDMCVLPLHDGTPDV